MQKWCIHKYIYAGHVCQSGHTCNGPLDLRCCSSADIRKKKAGDVVGQKQANGHGEGPPEPAAPPNTPHQTLGNLWQPTQPSIAFNNYFKPSPTLSLMLLGLPVARVVFFVMLLLPGTFFEP